MTKTNGESGKAGPKGSGPGTGSDVGMPPSDQEGDRASSVLPQVSAKASGDVADGLSHSSFRQAGDPASAHARRDRVLLFWTLALALIAVDQLTKWAARTWLSQTRETVLIPHVLGLRLLFNPGATLGFGSARTGLIGLLAAVVSIALVVLAFRTRSKVWLSVLSLAFAGAVGNLIDRLAFASHFLDGPVTDFLDYGWSVGNVADIYLTVVAVLVAVLLIRQVPFGSSGDAR